MYNQDLVETVIADKFRIVRRIGGGSFGEIYLCVGPNGTEVAAKFEKKEHVSPQLRHEYKVYRELKGSRGICSVYYFGDHLNSYNVVVMELMGPSLEDLFEKCRKRFSLKTVLQIADQLINRVSTLHDKSIIHRDIKPQNFVIGIGNRSSTIYCVDFGLAKLYRDRRTLDHLPLREGSLAGTPRYASIANHDGIAQSRRDDFESVAYMLIYFLKGKLPWQGLKANDKRVKYGLILETKLKIPIKTLCEGLPDEFAEFLTYCRHLLFSQQPNVDFMKKLFSDLYIERGYDISEGKLWDWDAPVVPTNAFPPSSVIPKPTEEGNNTREKEKSGEKWDAKGVASKGAAQRVSGTGAGTGAAVPVAVGVAVEPVQSQLELEVGTPVEGTGGGGGVLHTVSNGNATYNSMANHNGTSNGMDVENPVVTRK